ncbi:hypothetical protein BHU72_03415 [Desulfuribacillus stibiiarsenatis]|uniref:Uncharacterized protein n=1 Tax=Desulfuribacillus stibiiarsenatis TaxID=1390249 RepID=A0A1E5L6U1_9FIRM|nr:hypothetical protein [Desulfuribacillus stibiiarsenatis]OEH85841.1 hypothetical protein BHU72_03415 [Desulfuribacillus stibiiarsenatis]
MKLRIFVSISAFVLTFLVSIYSNVFFTAIKRSIFSFILFYIIATIIEKLLEKEIMAFDQVENCQQDLDAQSSVSGETSDANKVNNNEDIDFQPLKYDELDIDNMDPEMIAKILRNFDDDKKS